MTNSTTTTLLPASDKLLDVSDDGRYLSYVEASGAIETLYVLDIGTGQKYAIDSYMSETGGIGVFTSPTGIDGGILSSDGRFIFYSTGVTDDNPTNSASGVQFFVKDLHSATPPVNVTPNIPQTPYPGIELSLSARGISDDGQTILYAEDYTDFTDQNPSFQGFVVAKLGTGTTQQFSTVFSGSNSPVQLTPDGNYLIYSGGNSSIIQNLQSGTQQTYASDFGGTYLSDNDRYLVYGLNDQILVHDNGNPGSIDKIVSSSADGTVGNGESNIVAVSGDGRHVIFRSAATNLVANDTDGVEDLFVKDLDTGSIKIIPAGQFISYDGSQIIAEGGGGVTVTTFQPPTLTINPVTADNYVNAAEGPVVTVSGTSDAIGETVLVSLPNTLFSSSAVVGADGIWSTGVNTGKLQDGLSNIHAVVTNDYRLTSSADHAFTVDRTPPTNVSIISVAGDNYINAAELSHAVVTGTVLVADPTGPGAVAGTLQLKIDQGPSTTFPSQANPTAFVQIFSQTIDATGFADGTHTVTLTAIDEAGNQTIVTKQIIIDTTPPKISVTSVSGDDVIDSHEIKTTQGVHGTSDAIGQTVDVLIDGVEAGQAVVQADGTWLTTVSFAGTTTGQHDVTANVADEAGNIGRADAFVYVDRGFSVQQLSAGPQGQQGAGGQGVLFPELSADGTKLVFTGLNFDLMSIASGSSGAQVYIKNLTTGAITFATPNPAANAEFGAISQDGTKLVFVSNAALDPSTQAMIGDPPGYYTYEENLSDGVPHFRAFDSQTPDTLDLSSELAAGHTLVLTPPTFPLAIANNGYDSEMVMTTATDTSGTVSLAELFVLDGSVDATGKATSPYNQLRLLGPNVSSPNPNYGAQEYAPQFSADGSVTAFEARLITEQFQTSPPYALLGFGPGTIPEIYAGSTSTSSVPLASSYADGTPMPFGAIDPALSADGQFVAFWSWGTDDVPEVFVKNLATGELKIASSDVLGNPGVNNASGTFNAGFGSIAISADGRYVAFTSDAVLTPDDAGTGADLFVKDMQTGAIQRIDLPPGTFAEDLSTQLTMRADGHYIAFTTTAALSPFDGNGVADVYGLSLASMGSTPPKITINAVTGDDRINAAETSKNLKVSGTSDAIGQTVTLYTVDGALPGVIVAADGTWSTTINTANLPDNTYQLRATVANAAGATASAGDIFTLDTVAPTVKLSSDKTHLSAGQTATITASFSKSIGNVGSDFLTASGGTLSALQFTNDHTLTALFTPDVGATTYSIDAKPDAAFDLAGNPGTGATLTAGLAFDGYLSGSTIFADANLNGVCDSGEATATSDAMGGFVLNDAAGPLILTGGTDISSGLSFTGKLEAPAGSTVVTPLTTVVETLIETSGGTAAQAGVAVVAALGLPLGIDLTTLDAIAGAQSGDPTATAVFEIGAEVLDTVALIQAAGGSAVAAYAALAADFNAASAAGTTIDLTDAVTIAAIAAAAGLDAIAAPAVASIASQTDAALEHQLAGISSPLQAFIDITGASIAQQGDAASALAQAKDDTGYQQVMASYLQSLGATLGKDDLAAADRVACYCLGTMILTDHGDVPVEQLSIGDLVVTKTAEARPIKWIGLRRYARRFALGQKQIMPICIEASAIDDHTPARDLWISPQHAIYIDGILIEAKDLLNGTSIFQSDHFETIEYFHVELDEHVLLAEGAWSETFIDDDSRNIFHNAHEFEQLYPAAIDQHARYCAPRLANGFAVQTVRERINGRALQSRAHARRLIEAPNRKRLSV